MHVGTAAGLRNGNEIIPGRFLVMNVLIPVTMAIQKSCRANSLVVYTVKFDIYLGDISSTWLTDVGGGSESEFSGTPVRTELSGIKGIMTRMAPNNRPHI